MKPTREEIKQQASRSGGSHAAPYHHYRMTLDDLERFALAMYQRGAEDMRERAALEVQQWFDPCEPWITPKTIRALPIGDE